MILKGFLATFTGPIKIGLCFLVQVVSSPPFASSTFPESYGLGDRIPPPWIFRIKGLSFVQPPGSRNKEDILIVA
jgi:hypothetical protein